MTMNSSGPISLGGATAGQSINLENGQSATAQVSLNDTAVRNLAGVASGAITMPTNFWGKSNRAAISYTFSSNTSDASLNLDSISGYSAGKSDITVTINSGVYIYATTTGGYGLNLSGATTGDTVTIVNNGYIMGKGGGGCNWWNGYYNPSNGRWPETGGPALNLNIGVNPTITNTSGYIGGGGGGGAGGHGWNTAGSGGGGGAGGGNGGGIQGNMPGWGAGAAGGGPGSSGSNPDNPGGGGGGGRIMPGSGGLGAQSDSQFAQGGGAGGGGGENLNLVGGNGGSAGNSGGAGSGAGTKASYSGGGGGWGASGGSAWGNNGQSGTAAGGKAINLNGLSITWTGGSASSSRVYGAVS